MENKTIICEFSDPVLFDGSPATSSDFLWNFKTKTCEFESCMSVYELIENEDHPGREFFADKSFSYGDVLILFFLTIAFVVLIAGKIFSYFWSK